MQKKKDGNPDTTLGF